MAFSVVNTVVGSFGSSGGTTSGITTSGSDLIIIGINYHNGTAPNVSDSKGNTWTLVQTQMVGTFPSSAAACSLYYCSNPTVGTSHTFSTTSHFVNIFVLAVSGSRTASTPLDQQNGANANADNVSSGSITTSVTGCISFCVFGAFNPGQAPTITSGGTGWTIPTGWAIGTSTSEAGAAAYRIETGVATENLTWKSVNSPHATAVIASFMPPAVAPTSNGKFFIFF